MPFKQKLKKIDQLSKEIESRGKLPLDVLQKINYKFRLDWNYYSNRMEGNTLTIEETKSVMLDIIDIRKKPLKDVMEIKGHDEAIQAILKMGKGELNVSESRIKDLHNTIMYEDINAEREKIGKWKTQKNRVTNYKDEDFYFTDPLDVADKMHELVDWINAEKDKIKAGKKNALHPVELAFDFHLRYITIHPFYDGNGRTGRILTNLILISFGFPPVYVKDTDKTLYYRYLADVQAYGAEKILFFDIMADYLLRSLNIVLDAIKGKDIDEPDDLDKKIQLLEVELNTINPDDEVKVKYSKEAFLDNYNTWITKLLAYTVPVIQKFNKMFTGTNHHINIMQTAVSISFINEPIHEITQRLTVAINENLDRIGHMHQDFFIHTSYGTLIKGGLKSFGCNYTIQIKFDEIKYEVFVDDFDETSNNRNSIRVFERLLHQSLNDKEMNDIAQMLGNTIFKHIDFNTKKIGLRQ